MGKIDPRMRFWYEDERMSLQQYGNSDNGLCQNYVVSLFKKKIIEDDSSVY